MNAHEYILSKQIQWAKNRGISLIGSKLDRGRHTYAEKIDNNLFQQLTSDVREEIENGDGGELTGYPSKMQAIHSSSALGVNIFQYWKSINQISDIAYVCGFCRKSTKISNNIKFEKKYEIDSKFQFSPNIDVVIENDPGSKHKVYAIECKFSEAYSSRSHTGMKEKYLNLDIWDDIPNLRQLALSISPKDDTFEYLHPAQLIKHILGLKQNFGKRGFRLSYLWYNVLGYEGAKHEEEISKFEKIVRSDNIYFHALSYQDLIIKLAKNFRENHPKYIQYITNRYL